MYNKFFLITIFWITMISCQENKTYLTGSEKDWNPYKLGQTVFFESRKGLLDTIHIDDVSYEFPDGLGVVDKYEILKITGGFEDSINQKKWSNYILEVHAATDKRSSRIKFGLALGNSKFYSDYFLIDSDLSNIPEIKYSGLHYNFDDVLILRDKENHSDISNAIKIIYWSKRKGYIRFDKYDGSVWELRGIENKE